MFLLVNIYCISVSFPCQLLLVDLPQMMGNLTDISSSCFVSEALW